MTSGFTYRYSNVEPLYRFGHGLSYSSFSYNNLGFNATTITIYFDVKNIGQRLSDEVVGIYLSIHLKNTSLTNVSRAQLVDFNRLSYINSSEIVHYQAIIKPERFEIYSQKIIIENILLP